MRLEDDWDCAAGYQALNANCGSLAEAKPFQGQGRVGRWLWEMSKTFLTLKPDKQSKALKTTGLAQAPHGTSHVGPRLRLRTRSSTSGESVELTPEQVQKVRAVLFHL